MAFLGPSLRRTKVLDRPARRVAAAVLISLTVNAGLLLVLGALGAFDAPRPVDAKKVELAELSRETWEQNRTIRNAPTSPSAPPRLSPPARPPALAQEMEPTPPPKIDRPEPSPSPEVKERDRRQVVDVAPSADTRPSPDARFLSERDNRVEKETRSRLQGSGTWRNRAPLPIPGADGRKKGGEGGADDETREARRAREAAGRDGGKEKPAPEARPAPDGDRLARLDRPTLPRTGPDRPSAREGDRGAVGIPGLSGDAQEGKQRSGDPRLLPSLEDMSRIAAGPSSDALPADLEEGDVTALNTKSYRFATFWNRFKQDVADHWFPGIRYEIDARDPDGAVFGRSDRVTGLRIVLDASGAVKKIEITAPSGLDFLDRVAVKSVRDASPFYNVPAGLLDANGELSFEFGFLVGGSRGTPVRPRWQPPP